METELGLHKRSSQFAKPYYFRWIRLLLLPILFMCALAVQASVSSPEQILSAISQLQEDTIATTPKPIAKRLLKYLRKAERATEKGNKDLESGKEKKAIKDFNKALRAMHRYADRLGKLMARGKVESEVAQPLLTQAAAIISQIESLITGVPLPESEVSSSVLSDVDDTYPTGRMVRIDVVAPEGPEIVSGTIRITSVSKGYDSGIQDLQFGSIFYNWDTTGLQPGTDYQIDITLIDVNGQTYADSSLTITLAPNPPLINKLVSEVDTSFPSQGLPVQFTRTYLLDSTFDGPLGYGWTHNYRMRILETDTMIQDLTDPSGFSKIPGMVQLFNSDGTASFFQPNFDGTYQSLKGDFRTLTKAPNGVYTLSDKYGKKNYFSGNGKPFRIEDRNGNAITLQYDGFDMLDSVTDASGQVMLFSRDENNRIWAVTDPAGRSVFYEYDSVGNLVAVTDIGGEPTTYAYDSQHNLKTVTNPLGNRTFFSVDGEDRLLSVFGEGDANKVTFQYETPAADKMTITDILGNTTIVTYDNNASIIQVVDALGNVSGFTYDADLNLISVSDAKGNQSLLSYDARGNLVSSTDAAGNMIGVTYELVFNQVTSLTDAKGNTTTFEYNANGNLIKTAYPDGSIESFVYDSFGNLNAKTDRKGQTIDYFYDTTGRLIEKSFPDGSSDMFTYDTVGNLITATDENGTISFFNDSADRIVQVIYPGGETVSYEYDAAGNRSRMIYPSGLVLDYEYDELNQLTYIRSKADTIATYTYDLLSRTIRRELKNGTFTTYSYDSDNQLTELINRKSTGEVISSFAYTNDSVGNRTSIKTLQGTTSYIYDEISQLIKVIEPGNVVTNYDLDATGNRISVTENTGTAAYTTNTLNQYTDVGDDTYTYDENGNLASKITSSGTTTYIYNFDNQLIQVATPSEMVSYVYDSLGRRISKTTANGTVSYFHDGLQVIMEKDETNVAVAEYVYGIDIDEILLMHRSGIDFFYSHDGLTSVSELTDSAENIVEAYSYSTYGIPNIISSLGNRFLYTGREYEQEINLYHYRARFYDPSIGRFLNADPIGYMGGINLYAYVGNNPVNRIDPLGLDIVFLTQFGHDVVGITDPTSSSGFRWFQFFPKGNPFWSAGTWRVTESRPRGFHYATRKTTEAQNVALLKAFYKAMGIEIPYNFCLSNCIQVPEWIINQTLNNNSGNGGNNQGSQGGTCQEEDPELCAPDPTFVQGGNVDRWLLQSSVESSTTPSLLAKIKVPYIDSLVRADVPIFGLAYGEKFKEYRVEYGEGSDPDIWTTLSISSIPQLNQVTAENLNDSLMLTIHGNLATWDTGLTNYVYLPSHPKDHPINLNGTYTLRLVVTGTDGTEVEDRVTVHVANVIPNPWGGLVHSKDEVVTLSVPEQSIRDSFRLISIQLSDKEATTALPTESAVVGNIYQVREPGERFSKEAVLRIAFDTEEVNAINPALLGIHGYDSDREKWEHVESYRKDGENAVYTKVRRLHAYYALMAGTDPMEGSVLATMGENRNNDSRRHMHDNTDPFLVRNSFEKGPSEWSNRDHEVGGEVALDETATYDGTRALRITNTNAGGNFAVNAVTTPFDVREYPIVQFDYRMPAGVKTNLLAKVAGRWYEVGFTDDPNPLESNRVNIAHVGEIADVVTDDKWHTARFNLYDMLRTRTGNTRVEEIVLADWDVKGYMLLQYGRNVKGATYYIDNFSIGRDPASGLRLVDDRVLIDDFNQKKTTNRFGSHTETFTDSIRSAIEVGFSEETVENRGHALALTYDMSADGNYAVYVTHLPDIDLRDFQGLSLRLKGTTDERNALIGLRDHAGRERKVPVMKFVRSDVAEAWQSVTIPLAAFGGDFDWNAVDAVTLSFESKRHANGTLLIDDLAFDREVGSFLVDDFEQATEHNHLGQQHQTFVNGAAAVNGQHTHGSPNGIYRISYGGNIGAINAYASELKSFAGWKTKLGGIDCTKCDELNFRVRGAVGGEDFTIYLDDGNFRWGVPVSEYVDVTSEWQEASIPMRMFADYGVDITHLESIDVVFEGQRMSGTVYLDDIELTDTVH